MKRYLTIFLIFATSLSYTQNYFNVCPEPQQWFFDYISDSSYYYITIDTAIDSNIWEYGEANKNIFITEPGNIVLITDASESYPTNNYSFFELYLFVNCDSYGKTEGYWLTSVTIDFSIKTTSGKDGGMVEITHSGSEWTNIVNDDFVYTGTFDTLYGLHDTVEALHEPGYSGTDLFNTLTLIVENEDLFDYDSIGLRFVFASDSIYDDLDGWMIKSISIDPVYEQISSYYEDDLIQIFPNPASESIFIKDNSNIYGERKIDVTDMNERIIYSDGNFKEKSIDVSQLHAGIYFLKYYNNGYFTTKKFVVSK